MPALNQNLTIWAERTVEIIVPILDQNGVPYDMTSGSLEWAMAANPYATPVLTKSTASGGIMLTEASGVWTAVVTILPADTKDGTVIPPTDYYHELAGEDSVGDIVNITIGTLTLMPSLNNPY